MDSSDLRLIIGLLFGAFLAIMVVSELVKRKPKAPKMKKKKDTGFQRTVAPTEPNAGFRTSPTPPTSPDRPQNNWKVPRN